MTLLNKTSTALIKKNRLFIALELPSEIKKIINSAISSLRKYGLDIKWVPVDNHHLTLVFLGDIPSNQVPLLIDIIDKTVRTNAEISVKLANKLDYFGQISNLKVLWIGFSKGQDELILLYKSITKRLSDNSFTFDNKDYLPHVTLGRFKSPKNINKLFKKIELDEYTCRQIKLNKLILFKSDLSASRPLYTKLYEAKLKSLKDEE